MSAFPRLLAEGGPPPRLDGARRGLELIAAVAAAGLRGRGGAAFPTAFKLRAVASVRGRRTLVVNAAEGSR